LLAPDARAILSPVHRGSPAGAALASLLFAFAACASPTTAPEGSPRVVARITDLLHAAAAPAPHATSDYPRATVALATRLVLANRPHAADQPTLLQASVALDLPRGAILEFDVAADGNAAAAAWITVDDREVVRIEDPPRDGWRTVRLPVEAGRRRLAFHSSAADGGHVWFGAPVLLAPREDEQRPTIVLVSLDTLRADALGIYGYERTTSPNIDRIFGSQGLVAEHAWTQGPGTVYGHVAMLRGTAFSTSVKQGSGRWIHSRAFPSLADELRAAGWRTAAFTEDAMLDGAQGFDWGFEQWFENVDTESAATIEPGKPKLIAVPGHIESTFDHGLAWLESHADQPAFLFLHTYQVHAPYTPPARLAHLFPVGGYARPVERERAAYDREVVYTDEQVGRLVAELDRILAGREWLLVITSDHGEEFGEHGRLGHGTHLTEPTLRVPVLALARGGLLPAGVRRPAPMGLMDLPPTLLDLVGLPPAPTMEGRSLAAHWRGEDATPPDRILPHEAWGLVAKTAFGADPDWRRPSFGVTRYPLRVTLVRQPQGPAALHMYDLEADPGETNDLVAAGQSVPTELDHAVRNVFADAGRRRHEAEKGLPPAPGGGREIPGLDDERARKLEALGYMEGDPGMR
jgi:arylsulfatase A-like enzyme